MLRGRSFYSFLIRQRTANNGKTSGLLCLLLLNVPCLCTSVPDLAGGWEVNLLQNKNTDVSRGSKFSKRCTRERWQERTGAQANVTHPTQKKKQMASSHGEATSCYGCALCFFVLAVRVADRCERSKVIALVSRTRAIFLPN